MGSGTRFLLNFWINFKWFCALFSGLFCKSCSFRYELKWLDVKTGDITGEMDPQVGGGALVTGGQFGMG